MKDKYKIINDYLNEFCFQNDNTFFFHNLVPYFVTSDNILKILKENDSFIETNHKYNKGLFDNDYDDDIYLDGVESLYIVRRFIKEKCPMYLDKLDTFIKNGTFDFTDSHEHLNMSTSSYSYTNKHREISINLHHNYHDPWTIIHEFIHQMNLTPEGYSDSRIVLTEGISIYFETLLFKYMEKLGYDKVEINRIRRYRTVDCFYVCHMLKDHILILDSYLKFGNISDNTYHDRNKYSLINWTNKETYNKAIDATFKELEKRLINPRKESGYLLGTLIAFSAIRNNVDIDKFIKLNSKINDTNNILGCLKSIGINLNMDKELFQSFKEEIISINKVLTEDKKKL